MKRARILSAAVLALALLVSIDLGFNFLKSTVPSMNDGIGCFSMFQIPGVFEPFGDSGWSQQGYLAAFEKSVWITFAVFAENLLLYGLDLSGRR